MYLNPSQQFVSNNPFVHRHATSIDALSKFHYCEIRTSTVCFLGCQDLKLVASALTPTE